MVRNSIESYMKSDFQAAFESIKGVPDTLGEPRFFTYRASLLLAVGRVDEARKDIEHALSLDPIYVDAFALQSMIAVVQNEKEKALDIAKKAVESDPKSASALIALSYAQQANFDLEGARNSLKQAARSSPDNALAWARLAELHMSFAELDEALEAAKKAVALDPNLSRTRTVLGFAFLTQVDTKEAKAAFEKAIEFDQADYLPRLGLGLAKIREGDLQEGRRDIEIAASLDPNNSIVRSYLGKAYFEEKRTELTDREYAIAKELDPKDPTPWFYDAIQKQTTNRPVEALRDMQQAIELNHNRAVYRSRLLLDSDLAARSASLGRIYSDLGFQQLALVEGWKSVNTDPSNFSAHRFLADSYSVLPRHEIARVSELLQSQLLQPISITPVQPQLAESNLLILSGAGPAEPSLNEFNPLFVRDRFALLASGVAGNDETIGDELVQSTVWGKASYSLGQFHYETNGFRENNDLRQDIYNAFVQFSLSPKTSVQAEFRFTDTKQGDREVRFNPDDFLPNLRQQRETESGRLGFHHSFSPRSDVIASFIYRSAKEDTQLRNPIVDVDSTLEENGFIVEVQHLFRSEPLSVISGIGHVSIDVKDVETVTVPPDPPSSAVNKKNTHHTNFYLYSQINYLKNVTATVGGSADFFKGAFVDRDQFNPKFGMTWNPLPNTTLRAAVFRVLKRRLISDQTIEPTQVAGFNQFFDDFEGTSSWRYGLGIDQKFAPNFYAGAELSKRDLDVPFVSTSLTGEVRRVDWKEYLARAYLYWTPHPLLAVNLEYLFERFDRDPFAGGGTGVVEVETHRLPLGISFFHTSGFSARLKATFVDQEGKFTPRVFEPGVSAPGADQFWVVDAGVGYRLPKRRGLITLEARNLFDEKFKFQDTDPANPQIQPSRSIFGRITLVF
jgi:tetratricopeptide (TPR) repeat protein